MAEIALEVGVDPAGLVAQLAHGLLQDTRATFAFTDDGRLVSGSSESAGEAGKVLLGLVGLGVTAAGLATGLPALGAVSHGFEAYGPGVEAPVDPLGAWKAEQPELGELWDAYSAAMLRGAQQLSEATTALLESADPVEQATLADRTRLLEIGLEVARRELARLQAEFAAWRAGTLETHSETVELLVGLDDLRRAGATVDEGGLAVSPVAGGPCLRRPA